MIKLTREQWEKIPDSYKGTWEQSLVDNGWCRDLPPEYVGKRNMLYYSPEHGTVLLTEGYGFEIV